MIRICALTVVLLLSWQTAGAQVRGTPVFFESTYGYANRLGVQVGHGGELGWFSLLAEGSHHFGAGRRRRFSLSAGAGIWNPPGPVRFTGALSAQARLDPAPSAGGIKRFTVRAITGLALLSDSGSARWSVPIGVGAGYAFIFPVIHIEPWIVPHLTWLQRSSVGPGLPGSDAWKMSVSTGVTLGLARIAGFRVASDCCVGGGLTMAYGLSAWF
jgi:hypothetical protein